MSRVEAASPDRLPWLPDEPQPQRARRRGSRVLDFAGLALAIIAIVALWIGTRGVQEQAPPPQRAQSSTTVPLPAPRAIEPAVRVPQQVEVTPSPVREVRPTPPREVRIAPPAKVVTKEAPAAAAPEAPKPEAASPAPVAAPVATPAKPWNPRIFNGAAGRIVQIGAFGSAHQSKLGWRYMVRAYPAVAHLPAVVRPTRNSHGRVFYRFQIGTTSQAHSEVLCQRMERISFSCAVVGLPWKAKVER